MNRFRTAAIVPILLALCAASAAAQTESVRLQPGDAVRLAVRDEPGLTGEFPVVASGNVLLPEIGFVRAADRPFADVARDVRQAYARYVVNPEVVLIPLVRVAVLGEVRRPGLFPVDPTQTIGDVLASAGGVTPMGNANRITLVRGAERTRLHLSPDEPALAAHLRSGDEIVVGAHGWLQQNLPVLVGAGASVLAAAVTSIIVRH